jgi:hypothetical protein
MLLLDLLGLLGWTATGVALWVLGRLSRRLGRVTRARSLYYGLYIGAGLIWAGMAARGLFLLQANAAGDALRSSSILYTLLADGLPAVGITLGLLVTWYYWSWLLAERD